MTIDRFAQLRLVEALLFASAEPLGRSQLMRHLPDDTNFDELMEELTGLYANRGVNLVHLGERWAFRSAPDLAPLMQIESTVVRKPTRAAVETLAIIAYHQPVTRAEIEEVRGVALSRGTLDTLLEAGWIKPKGRRRTPGKPVTWGTTDAFLDHFGLESLDSLPGVAELKAAGLIDTRPAVTALAGRGSLLAPGEEGEDIENADADDELEETELAEALESDFGEDLVEDSAEELAAEAEDQLVEEDAGTDDGNNTDTDDDDETLRSGDEAADAAPEDEGPMRRYAGPVER
jgi:segregation and condensation protein B